MARRVGVIKVITIPCNSPMPATCHHSRIPDASPTAVMDAKKAMSTAATIRIVRFENLSAKAPAYGARSRLGTWFIASVMPRIRADRSPSSKAIHGRANMVIDIAPK